MSVLMKKVVAPKYVQTLQEALIVDVIWAMYWTVMMELLVMVNIT